MTNPTEQLGGKFLLYIMTAGTVGGTGPETPVFTKVAGQRKGSFGRTGDVIKAQHKDSFPWYWVVRGFIQWTFDFDGVWITDDSTGAMDPSLVALQDAFEESGSYDNDEGQIYVQIVTPKYGEHAGTGSTYTGWAIISDFSLDGPHDNLITYTGKLTGNGAYDYVAI